MTNFLHSWCREATKSCTLFPKTHLCSSSKVFDTTISSIERFDNLMLTLLMFDIQTSICCKLRSPAAFQLMKDIASTGAAASVERGLYVPPGESGLDELQMKGYIQTMQLMGACDHNNFTLSDKGRHCVKHCTKLHSSKKLPSFERHGLDCDTYQDHTTVELILVLAGMGWSDQQYKSKTKNLSPATLGGDKTWFWTTGEKPSKLYLRVLVLSPKIFEAQQVRQIFHNQPQAYYRALLEGCSGVIPGQPLDFYKLLMKRKLGKETPAEGATDEGLTTSLGQILDDDSCHQAQIEAIQTLYIQKCIQT